MLYGTFIDLPSDLATSTLSTSGTLISDLSPYWMLIVGVLLAVLVVTFLVRALHK